MSYQERVHPQIYEFAVYASDLKVLALAQAVLLAAGTEQENIIEGQAQDRHSLKIFSQDPQQSQKLKLLFKKLKLPGIKTATACLKPAQWLTRWKTTWKPAPLTRRLDVVPVWYKDRYKPKKGRDFILMDTLLSFGTGLHETTQIMAQFIEDCAGQFQSFIDVGTGTGILTMVALKNGAQNPVAIDIGDLSVQAAKDNLKANGLRAIIREVDIARFKAQRQFDFVAANLVTQDLIAHKRQILKLVRPGGFLAVSGISLDNVRRLNQGFGSLPLKRLNIVKGKQWAGMLFQRKTS